VPSLLTSNEIIALLGLEPLPAEGGYFRQTYVEAGIDGPRTTAILYLVTPDSFSALHKLDAPELFHVYLGDACEQVIVQPDHSIQRRILGSDLANGQVVQSLVPAGCWQATRLLPGGSFGYALLGPTMTPGFQPDWCALATPEDLQSFEAGARNELERFLAPLET